MVYAPTPHYITVEERWFWFFQEWIIYTGWALLEILGFCLYSGVSENLICRNKKRDFSMIFSKFPNRTYSQLLCLECVVRWDTDLILNRFNELLHFLCCIFPYLSTHCSPCNNKIANNNHTKDSTFYDNKVSGIFPFVWKPNETYFTQIKYYQVSSQIHWRDENLTHVQPSKTTRSFPVRYPEIRNATMIERFWKCARNMLLDMVRKDLSTK